MVVVLIFIIICCFVICCIILCYFVLFFIDERSLMKICDLMYYIVLLYVIL